MRQARQYIVSATLSGLVLLVPLYLGILLLLKAMQSAIVFVRPFASLLPVWVPAERLLSLLLVQCASCARLRP